MPLKGLNVLEFSGLAPAPFVGTVLADFGANVIVVENQSNSINIAEWLTGGKRSICINLKHTDGTQIIEKLVTNTDIIIEPYRPGIMEKLGIGPCKLMSKNPRLIYARLNGYGSYGHYSQKPGHDINFLAISGLLSLYGSKNPKPIPPVNYSEFTGGSLVCVMGILMAVIERYKSGKGQVIDANITEGMMYAGSWLLATQNSLVWGKPKGQNILDGGMHFYDTYETQDHKWMAVGAIESTFYEEFIDGLGLNVDNIKHFDDFERNREIISKRFKEKTQKEWCKIFDSKDACVTPVLNINEVDQHPHNASRNSFIRKNNALISAPAPKLSETPGVSSAIKPLPKCGQHTVEILKSIGYSQIQIGTLLKNKTIFGEFNFKL